MSFQIEAPIAAAPATVWRHLTNPKLMERWMSGVTHLRPLDDAPLRSGSRLAFTARGTEHCADVVEFDAERAFALRSKQGAFTATYHYRLHPHPAGCHLVLKAECAAVGMARAMAPIVAALMRWSDRDQVRAIKHAVETSGTTEDGSAR